MGLKLRKEIEEQYKWDLSALYEDNDTFEKDIKKVNQLINEIHEYKGRILESSDTLYELIQKKLKIQRYISNLFCFARMSSDEDTRDTENQARVSKVQSLSVLADEKMSYIVPEILAGETDIIKKYIRENSKLALYEKYLNNILRQKPHVLSDKEEKLIAQSGEVLSGPSNIFNMLNNADLAFPVIKDEKGEDLQLTHGNFIKTLESKDRRVRKDAFEAYYKVYEEHKNTIASTLATQIKKDVFLSKVRNYDSALASALDSNKIPVSVYDNLIESVHEYIEPLHEYMSLRKKVLGVEELHMYDIYTPIVEDVEYEVSYAEAKELLPKALNILGEEYVSIVEKSFEDRWIDLYENKGKRSGAYSFGTYDSKPYILMNYQENVNSLFTLIHEMGHSMHSYLTWDNQPYVYGNYSIFLAEIASTTNEALLNDYLLETLQDEKKKLYIINHYLEQFRGTIYRQTMFAEFEKFMHEEVEKGNPLTVDVLNKKYKALNEFYYGEEMVVDEEIALEWARIPHFYYNYYVYQYATGFSAAIAMKERIKKEGDKAVEDYLTFLSSGSSDYPIDLLKSTKIDMTTKEPVEAALEVFKELVTKMKELMG